MKELLIKIAGMGEILFRATDQIAWETSLRFYPRPYPYDVNLRHVDLDEAVKGWFQVSGEALRLAGFGEDLLFICCLRESGD